MKYLCFVLFTATSFALLPPLAQDIREIQALLADSHFYAALGSGESIREIARNEKGYLVRTQHYALQVDVEYEKKQKIGPARFTLYFQEPIELQ